MLDRFEKPLKIACLILGALLLVQLARLTFRHSPVSGLRVPTVPTWIERTNGAQSSSSARTNAPGAPSIRSARTNSTNTIGALNSDSARTNTIATTNSISTSTNSASTNTAALADKKTSRKLPRGKMSSGPKMDLPAPIQARIDWVIKSEIFGSIPRPVPMGILGIAGDDVFLRTPSGQTGIVKEGAELDGVKILKIGVNRVLVESGGEKQELMIFAGTGGESLLPKEKEKESTK